MDDEFTPNEDTIEEPVEGTIDLSLGGMDLLRSAFLEPEATAVEEDSEELDGVPEPVPNAGADTEMEDYSKVFQDPRVIAALRQANQQSLAQARALWENELHNARAREEEALLSDEEIGERVRAQRALQPQLETAQQAGYARAQQDLIRFGIGDIFTKVPELANLSSDERETFNPTNPRYQSMGEYISALVDAAAAKRADKVAESRAKTLAKALVKEELAKIRKNQPSLVGVPGNGVAVDKMIDVERMTGRDLLQKAFG